MYGVSHLALPLLVRFSCLHFTRYLQMTCLVPIYTVAVIFTDCEFHFVVFFLFQIEIVMTSENEERVLRLKRKLEKNDLNNRKVYSKIKT